MVYPLDWGWHAILRKVWSLTIVGNVFARCTESLVVDHSVLCNVFVRGTESLVVDHSG
jgi:hypothetical protein